MTALVLHRLEEDARREMAFIIGYAEFRLTHRVNGHSQIKPAAIQPQESARDKKLCFRADALHDTNLTYDNSEWAVKLLWQTLNLTEKRNLVNWLGNAKHVAQSLLASDDVERTRQLVAQMEHDRSLQGRREVRAEKKLTEQKIDLLADLSKFFV